MKKIIRAGVFETNSSSMHSICIRGNQPERYTQIQLAENSMPYSDAGRVSFYYDELEFGRYPFQMLTSAYDKCRYAIASYGADIVPEVTSIYKEISARVGCKYPFTHFEFDKDGDGNPDYGCVDHQSSGLLQRFLRDKDITLKEFILNPNYYVVIDGDEYYDFNKYLDAGIIEKPKEVFR